MQTAKVVWTGGQRFRAISPSGHTIHLDSDRATNEGPGPMELLLMALGACTATDIVIILEKKRQKVDWLEVICSGERAPNPPTVWKKLEILFRIGGNLSEDAVKHAIALSAEKYCSVAATLQKTATLTWKHELVRS
jgi:putative redox protein